MLRGQVDRERERERERENERVIWGFPKIRDAFLGAPTVRTIIY